MNGPQLAVILDFDGTITMRDVGALIMREFGGDTRQAEQDYERGEISLRELWAIEISHLSESDHDIIRARSLELAEIRPGLNEFISFCRTAGIPVEIASSGIRFYIDAVLELAGLSDIPVAAPDIEYDERGRGLVAFRPGILDCDVTAMCKCERIRRQQATGRRAVFVGDGLSDQCAAPHADYLMAQGRLATYCDREGIDYTPYADFFDVRAFVRQLLRET